MKRFRILLTLVFACSLIGGCSPSEGGKPSSTTTAPVETFYKITWKNWNGTVLEIDNVKKGTIPTYDGETPTRPDDAQYKYTFIGWDKEVVAAYRDKTYTATFSETINTNNIVFEYNPIEDYYTFINVRYGLPRELIIPDSIEGTPVKGVSFRSICSFEKVYIPDSVEFVVDAVDLFERYQTGNLKLKEIRMSKNIKEFAYYESELIYAGEDEQALEILRQINFVEDDNGFYIPIGDNQKGILIYSKNNVLDNAVEMITCPIDLPDDDINFGHYPNLRYVGNFASIREYNDARSKVYNSITTGDKLTSFNFFGTVNQLNIGKNIQTINRGDYISHLTRGIEYQTPVGNLVGYDHLYSDYGRAWEIGDISIDPNNNYMYVENNAIYSPDKEILCYVSHKITSDYTINSNTKLIRAHVFENNDILENIHLNEGLEAIEEAAFAKCSKLKDVVLPDSLVTLGDYVFAGCYNMFRLTIGENFSIESWRGYFSFYHYSYVRNGSLIEIINHSKYTVDELSKNNESLSFINDESETGISLSEDGYYIYYADHDFVDIDGYYLLHQGRHILRYDEVKEEVTLPQFGFEGDMMRGLLPNAFTYASPNLKTLIINDYHSSLYSELHIDSAQGLTTVKVNANMYGSLRNLPCLTTVEMGGDATEVPNIYYCPNLENIILSDKIESVYPEWLMVDEEYPKFKANEYDNGYYLGTPTNPYYALIRVKDASKTNINIHDDCKLIAKAAFKEEYHDRWVAPNFTKIELPKGLKHINTKAFEDCDKITKIDIPSGIETIGQFPFYYCDSLKDINYYGSLEKWVTFSSDHYISVIQPNWVGLEGKYATVHFYPNDSKVETTSIVIPEYTYSCSFMNCSGLVSVSFDEGCTYIEREQFKYCTSLTTVTIHKNITLIGSDAFGYCSSLTKLNYEGTKAQWGKINLEENWHSNCPLTKIQCSDGVINL